MKFLALFGCVGRGDAKPDSDIDVLVEFEGPVIFDQDMRLKCFLWDLFEQPVELVTRKGIRPQPMSYIEAEAVHVS